MLFFFHMTKFLHEFELRMPLISWICFIFANVKIFINLLIVFPKIYEKTNHDFGCWCFSS